MSTYIPFFRRFTNEKTREIQETERLYRYVKAHQDAFKETKTTIGRAVYAAIPYIPEKIDDVLLRVLIGLLEMEPQIWDLPEPNIHRLSMKEFIEYRNLLHSKQYFFANKERILGLLRGGLIRLVYGPIEQLPELEAPSPFTIPLIYAIPEPRLTVSKIWGTLGDYYESDLFVEVTRKLYTNMCIASGRDPNEPNSKRPLISPDESKLPLNELVDTYLSGTPFHQAFTMRVPLKFTYKHRMSHMHILGGTDAGKTTLIENLIAHDLKSPEQPTVILIDPHSDLVGRLIKADLGIEDRLVYINPRDTEHFPALNIFAINRERFSSYDHTTQEQITAGVIQTFNYLFGGLTNLALTGKQDVFFRYVARLMLSLPDTEDRNATILDMLALMRDKAPYQNAINALPDIHQEFFRTDFMAKTFDGTKEQIRYRLQAIIENPTMARLFTSEETKIDLFTEMNRGSVILVDCAKDFLKENASTFGRLFIALVLQAALERAAIDEEKRKPTFLYVDEAASFFSSNIDDILTEARKYKMGLILGHQHLDQAVGSLKSSLHANTSIKMVGKPSAGDATVMAREMRTTAEFILDQPQYHFAAHIRNVTPQAVSIPISPVRHLLLSGERFAALIERNRKKVSVPPPRRGPNGANSFTIVEEGDQARPSSRPHTPPSVNIPDEDISAEYD